MRNDPPLASVTTLPRWSGLALRAVPLTGLRAAAPVLLGALGAAGMFVLVPPHAHLRLWACLAGVAALLHVASAVSASGLRALVLLLAAAAQFLLALRGAEHGLAWVGAAFVVGALATAGQSDPSDSSFERFARRAWVAFFVASVTLVWP